MSFILVILYKWIVEYTEVLSAKQPNLYSVNMTVLEHLKTYIIIYISYSNILGTWFYISIWYITMFLK